jgi:hypothetical protein
MNLVADGVVEPFRHVAPDELDRRHAADFVGIGLPQRAMKLAAGFSAPVLDRFRDLHLLEISRGQPPLIGDDRLPRVGIHHAAEYGPDWGTRYA